MAISFVDGSRRLPALQASLQPGWAERFRFSLAITGETDPCRACLAPGKNCLGAPVSELHGYAKPAEYS